MTLRMIAKEMGTNHHRIKRILVKNGVEITQKDRIRKPFTKRQKEEKLGQKEKRCPENLSLKIWLLVGRLSL